MSINRFSKSTSVKEMKRGFDVFASMILLVLFSPLFVAVMTLLLIVNKGQPFFMQKRPGKDGKIFRVIKFKTMNNRKGSNGELLPDGQRLTKAGGLIRKTSLDELPQLINVLKGDMSIVGPRPLLPEYIPLYNNFQSRRHEVRPGITGWAQVNGRNTIDWEEKFALDVWYVDHMSFQLDLKILLKTVLKVIRSEGINSQGQATTTPFQGNKNE